MFIAVKQVSHISYENKWGLNLSFSGNSGIQTQCKSLFICLTFKFRRVVSCLVVSLWHCLLWLLFVNGHCLDGGQESAWQMFWQEGRNKLRLTTTAETLRPLSYNDWNMSRHAWCQRENGWVFQLNMKSVYILLNRKSTHWAASVSSEEAFVRTVRPPGPGLIQSAS